MNEPPRFAAWRHRGARDGFEVTFLARLADGYRLQGGTTAVENGAGWMVEYRIELDSAWLTRSAHVRACSESGSREVRLESDGSGSWTVDGVVRPDVQGCLDVDLESSALTNALPVHRLDLDHGHEADAPAAYVRALDLCVERLEQHYVRLDDHADGGRRYGYRAPAFDFECRLHYDASGLVLDYPGIAVRVA